MININLKGLSMSELLECSLVQNDRDIIAVIFLWRCPPKIEISDGNSKNIHSIGNSIHWTLSFWKTDDKRVIRYN